MTSTERSVDVQAFIDEQRFSPFQWTILVLCFLVVAADGFSFTAPVSIGEEVSFHADIVATGYDSNGNNGVVLVFYQLPAQRRTFTKPASFPAGAGPQSVKVADMNGDALPDLVVANFGPGSDGTGIPGVSILLQDALTSGSFLAPASYQTPGGSLDVAVGDLNGDGKPDVAVAGLAPTPSASISVLLQDPAHPGTLLAATSYPGFGQPLGVAIGDLNGDGLADIAAADGSSATVMLQISGKPGQFAPAVQVGQ